MQLVKMMSSNLLLLLLLLFHITAVIYAQEGVWATLYSGQQQTGEHITTEDYLPDLAQLNFDDKTNSICGAGVWLLYEHHDYDSGGFGEVTPILDDGTCQDLPQEITGKVSSIRQAGSVTKPALSTLTLYAYTNYRGIEFYATRDYTTLGLFSDQTYSAIVTGNQSWTVYTYAGYGGYGKCLEPNQEIVIGNEIVGVGLFPTYTELGSSGSIRSVRQGCHT